MGRRGKAPMPTAMRKKLGIREKSKQKKRLRRGAEPQPREIVDTTAPSSLQYDADAVQCWNQLAPLLKELRLFTEGDTLPLEGLCRAYSRAVQADRAIETYGIVVKNDFGTLVKNPACAISQTAWSEVRKFCQEFGLTPASRSRVRVTPGEDGTEDPKDAAEDFLFGKRKVAGHIGPR
jgi:P27 family predicted phage terminase small subunit